MKPNGFTRPKASDTDELVERLHALHDQRKEQMDAVREQVFRQREEQEKEEMRKASAFRAKPIMYKKGPPSSKAKISSPTWASQRLGTPRVGKIGMSRNLPASPHKAPNL